MHLQEPAMFDDSIHFDSLPHDVETEAGVDAGADADMPDPQADVTTRRIARQDVDFGNLMTLYLRDVRRWPALDGPAEAALFDRIEEGDTLARDALICHHLGLVIAMARRFNQRGLELLDLIEEGNLALLVALGKFDRARALRFSTYAGWWVRYFLQTALATQVPIVRPPLRAQKRARSGAWAQWQALHGVDAPDSSTAHALVTSIAMHDDDIEERLADAGQVGNDVSEEVSASRDGPRLALLLRRLLADLPVRQRELLIARFGLDGQDECTLADLGKGSGVSRERMRQVQVTALQALRDGLERAGITRHCAI
jgi:RNA polymerase sigma factor (sigma-70 family)